ncbi:MAG: hypothetical protein AB1589_02730 [Cyanobacteriota bacterium]
MQQMSIQQEAADEKTSSDRLFELAKTITPLAQRVAQNPTTPPEVVRKLSESRDLTIRSYVTANPNTPTEVLLNLGAEFPLQLLDNPIFSLWLLENPNLGEQIPLNTLVSLLKCETVPVFFLERAANHTNRQVLLAVAMNLQTSTVVLEKLIQSRDAQVAEAARLHVNIAGEMNEGWDEVAQKACQVFGNTDSAQREYLEEFVKRSLIPEFVLEHLASHKDKSIREFVASNPNTPVQLLKQLAQDKDIDVRRCVARNPNTPLKLLQQLTQDEDNYVRLCIACKPDLPVQILKLLKLDHNILVDVASNPNTPVQVLEQLAQHDNYSFVRMYVASNPNTPVQVLEQLAEDDKYHFVRMCVACNPNTPFKFLEQLVQDEDKRVRRFVAKNPNIPVQLLDYLIQSDYHNVRHSAARNPNTPLKLLEQLMQDEDKYVRSFAARNPNNPINLFLEAMLKDCVQDCTLSLLRFLVLLHPQTPAKTLAENRYSSAWLERYAIAKNPNTPLDTLNTLAKDANRIVRAAAKANIDAILG